MEEQNKKFVSLSIWVSIIAFAIRCLISRVELVVDLSQNHYGSFIYNLYGYAGEAILLSGLFMWAYDKYLWKIRPFSWVAKTPILGKHYSGKYISSYKEMTGVAELFVSQTFLHISVRMKTGESTSRSFNSTIKEINDTIWLVYNYQNDPKANLQDNSPIHYGTAIFDLCDGVENIQGTYFTGRQTKGDLIFKRLD
jgi:hypothetical protein